jgi:hypothetical protein
MVPPEPNDYSKIEMRPVPQIDGLPDLRLTGRKDSSFAGANHLRDIAA